MSEETRLEPGTPPGMALGAGALSFAQDPGQSATAPSFLASWKGRLDTWERRRCLPWVEVIIGDNTAPGTEAACDPGTNFPWVKDPESMLLTSHRTILPH